MKGPRLITILILTAITIVVWITVGVVTIFKNDTEVDISEQVRSPLDPTFDTEQLNTIEQRLFFSQNELVEVSIDGQESKSSGGEISEGETEEPPTTQNEPQP